MENLRNFSKGTIEISTNMWKVREDAAQPILQLVNNKVVDHVGGKVALFKELEHKCGQRCGL